MNDYHLFTAYHRGSTGGYGLDWSNQPSPFKEYLERRILPLPKPRPPKAAFFDLAVDSLPEAGENPPELESADLAAVLLLSAGITAPYPPGLRAPASAGALYPAELYVTACGLGGLEDGLYHFAPQGPGLHPLWEGSLAGAAGKILGRGPAGLTFFITAIYWRSLWKYRTRAYRYCLLDAGHMLANLELALAACGARPLVTADFADASAGVFLGLASEDEAVICAAQAGGPPEQPGPANPGLPPLDRHAKPLSARMGRDPDILAAHAYGELTSPGAPRTWLTQPAPKGAVPLPPPSKGGPTLWEIVPRRRSRRNFVKFSLDKKTLASLLAAALPEAAPLRASIMVPANDGLPSGVYDYIPQAHVLTVRNLGEDRRHRMAQACLGKMWVSQAALVLLLWADLTELEEMGGPRAYRHAMLAAGKAGQRLYLAATALKLGCCGVGAFYDEEVKGAAILPENGHPLYVLACGPVKGRADAFAG